MKKHLPNTNIQIATVGGSVILSSKNGVPWKKKQKKRIPLTIETTTCMIFLDTIQYEAEVLYAHFSSCHTEFLKDVYSCWDLIHWIFLTVSS